MFQRIKELFPFIDETNIYRQKIKEQELKRILQSKHPRTRIRRNDTVKSIRNCLGLSKDQKISAVKRLRYC